MMNSFSRRQAMRMMSGPAMATTFLPFAGPGAAYAHPAEKTLLTRPLGKTGREVTTFGLAGGNKVMWNLPGDEGAEIVVKAVRAGITYLETANNYQLSQRNYHKAFRILKLIPGEAGYDAALRGRVFLATKSGLRHSIVRDGSTPMGRSAGGGKLVTEDLLRALTQFFGDDKGFIPEGAYIDLFQIHSLTREEDVDAVFEGMENPSDKTLPRVGALAALVDFRDGTNLTGLNPRQKKYIRHIGITGHENAAAHMYAMRRDKRNDLQTLLVAVNPNDRHYFCHQTNSVAVAAAKGMGLIGMKVFADGVMYGLERKYASQPGQSVATVGQAGKVAPEDFLRYTLSAEGMSTIITGIGLIDRNNDPKGDQLAFNLTACQNPEPMSKARRAEIEQRVAGIHGIETNFFQRTSSGLLAPQSVTGARVAGGAVKVSWGTAYAAGDPLLRYEVYRREEKIATVAFRPQTSMEPFSITDTTAPASHAGGVWYRVRVVDATGRTADSNSVKPL
ncbi:MAG: aldo/keto reductase [Acidobacteriia bacterium]|nr:aldo/keto reductase [Terriglobia bacterium]